MQLKYLISALFAANAIHAAVNEPCVGGGGKPGVCISAADCTSGGGTSISGACPSDADNIKCCTKPSCSSGTGNCRWGADCPSTSVANQCPGPGAFKCCQSSANGYGGFKTPSFPAVGACKQVAVDGAKRIVAQFPGRVHEIGCTRDCTCGAAGASDHCCGKANDIMCSDGGGQATNSGEEIAEWVMKHKTELKVKYVIWGQRIWNADEAQKDWTNWRPMEDRNSITANHWDHVHVSYN